MISTKSINNIIYGRLDRIIIEKQNMFQGNLKYVKLIKKLDKLASSYADKTEELNIVEYVKDDFYNTTDNTVITFWHKNKRAHNKVFDVCSMLNELDGIKARTTGISELGITISNNEQYYRTRIYINFDVYRNLTDSSDSSDSEDDGLVG
jgi:hypothetical protein